MKLNDQKNKTKKKISEHSYPKTQIENVFVSNNDAGQFQSH